MIFQLFKNSFSAHTPQVFTASKGEMDDNEEFESVRKEAFVEAEFLVRFQVRWRSLVNTVANI